MRPLDSDGVGAGDAWNGTEDRERLLCCFCARRIAHRPAMELTLSYPDASWIPLWAHIDCLVEKLHPAVPTRLRSSKKRPNKAPEPTPGLVTPRALE